MASYYDAWKKSRGEEDDDKKKQQTTSGESTSTSDNNLVKEESKTSYYEAWMKSRGEEIPVDKPKEVPLGDFPVKEYVDEKEKPKKNLFETISSVWRKLTNKDSKTEDLPEGEKEVALEENKRLMEGITEGELKNASILGYETQKKRISEDIAYYSELLKKLELVEEDRRSYKSHRLEDGTIVYYKEGENGTEIPALEVEEIRKLLVLGDDVASEEDVRKIPLDVVLNRVGASQIKENLEKLYIYERNIREITKQQEVETGIFTILADQIRTGQWKPITEDMELGQEEGLYNSARKKLEDGMDYSDLSMNERMAYNEVISRGLEADIDRGDITEAVGSLIPSARVMAERGIFNLITLGGGSIPVIGDLAQAVTFGSGRTLKDFNEMSNTQYDIYVTEDGVGFVRTGEALSEGEALARAVGGQTLQNFIENKLGQYISRGAGRVLTKVGNTKAMTGVLKQLESNQFGRALTNSVKILQGNKVLQKIAQEVGWDGFIGESAEEGLQDISDHVVKGTELNIFNPEWWKQVGLSVGIMSLLGLSARAGANTVSTVKQRKTIDYINKNKEQAGLEGNQKLTYDGKIINEVSGDVIRDFVEEKKQQELEQSATISDEGVKQDTPVVDVEEEMLKADIAQAEEELKAEPVQEVKIQEDEVKTDYSQDAQVQEVLRDISLVLDAGARKKVVSKVGGSESANYGNEDYSYGVEGMVIPEFIPEELRSRKYVQKAYDAFLNNEVPQEGTKAWQVYQAILDESTSREGLEIQKPEVTLDTVEVMRIIKKETPVIQELVRDVMNTKNSSILYEVLTNRKDGIYDFASSGDAENWIQKFNSRSDLEKENQLVGVMREWIDKGIVKVKTNNLQPKTQKEQVKEGKFALKVEKLRKDAPVYITDLKVSDEAVNVAFEKLTGADIDMKDIPADLRTEVQKALDAINGEMDKRIAEDTVLQREMEGGFTREELAGYLQMDVLEDRAYEEEMKNMKPVEEDKITDADLPFRDGEGGLLVLNNEKLNKATLEELKSFNRQLFGDENVKIVEQLLTPSGRKALGKYYNAWISLKKGQANIGSTYVHEAGHKALKMFLTPEERKRMLEEVLRDVPKKELLKYWGSKSKDEQYRSITAFVGAGVANLKGRDLSLKYIGTGEGALSLGYGLYATESYDYAEGHAKRFGKIPTVYATDLAINPTMMLRWSNSDQSSFEGDERWGEDRKNKLWEQGVQRSYIAKQLAVKWAKDERVDRRSASGKEIFENKVEEYREIFNRQIDMGGVYNTLSGLLRKDSKDDGRKLASEFLSSIGFDGIMGKERGEWTYVLFKTEKFKNWEQVFSMQETFRGGDMDTNMNVLAEEWLVENIIDYMNNKTSTTFLGKLKRMVEIFLDRLFNGIDHIKDIEDFYESLISGRLLDRQQKFEAKQQKNWNKYLASIQGAGTRTDQLLPDGRVNPEYRQEKRRMFRTQVGGVLQPLVTLHNISAENLLLAQFDGKLPAPSLAVTKPENPIRGFGEITLVGGREIVDPEVNYDNRLYSHDIYSPRVPAPEYDINNKEWQKFYNSEEVERTFKEVDDYLYNLQDAIQHSNPKLELEEDARRSWGMKALYLREKGVEVPIIYQPFTFKFSEYLDTKAFKDNKEFFLQDLEPDDEIGIEKKKKIFAEMVKEYVKDYSRLETDYMKEVYANDVIKNYTSSKNHFWDMYSVRDGIKKREQNKGTVVDTYATRDAISKKLVDIDGTEKKFEAWIKDYFAPVFSEPYIKISGKKEPYTTENKVRAMFGKGIKGQEGTLFGGINLIKARGAKQYKSIAQAKRDSYGRLVSEAQYDEITSKQYSSFSKMAERLSKYKPSYSGEMEFDFRESEGLEYAMGDYARGSRTMANFLSSFRRNGYEFDAVTDEYIIEKAKKWADRLLSDPVPYLEAKPRRAVALNEFTGAIMPSYYQKETNKVIHEKILKILNDNGIDRIFYVSDDTMSDKSRIINEEFEDVKYRTGDNPTPEAVALEQEATVSVKLPELITMATELGANIKLQKSFRKDGKLGDFTAGEDTDSRIRILRTLFEPKTETVTDSITGEEMQLPETEEQRRERVNGIEKVLAHEIGHLFDWFGGTENMTLKRGNILGRIANLRNYTEGQFMDLENKDIRRELKALTQVWNPFDEASVPKKYKTYRYSAKELYAEALSVFLNKPSLVKEVAPNFYQGFVEYLARKSEVKKELFTIMDMIKEGEEIANRIEKTDEGFVEARGRRMNAQERKLAMKREKKWSKEYTWFKSMIQDVHAPYLDKMRKAWKKGGIELSRLEEAKQLMNNLNKASNDVYRYGEHAEKEFFNPVREAGIDIDYIGKILMLERNMGDRKDLANPQGLNYDYAKETYDAIKKKLTPAQWELLEEKLKWWREYNFKLVEDGYKAGVYSESFFKEIATVNKNTYTPFAVVHYINDTYVSAGVIQAVGTLSTIENPIDTQMLKSASLIRLTKTNDAKLHMIKDIKDFFPDEIKKAEPIRDADGRITSFRRDPEWHDKGYRMLELLEDGQRVAYYIDGGMKKAFTGLLNDSQEDVQKIMWVFNSFNRIAKPLFTTLKAGFSLYTNPLKDFSRSTVNLAGLSGLFDWKNRNVVIRTGKVYKAYIQEYINSFKTSWKMATNRMDDVTEHLYDIYLFKRDLKMMDVELSNDLFYYNAIKKRVEFRASLNIFDDIRRKIDENPKLKILNNTIGKLYDGLLTVGMTLERNSKIAGFQVLKRMGASEKEAVYYADKKIGTPAYSTKGHLYPVTNDLFIFSNVGTQALFEDAELLVQNPKTRSGAWFAFFLQVGVPVLVQFALSKMAKVLIPDPDDPEKEKEVNPFDYASEYQKATKNLLPIAYDEDSKGWVFAEAPAGSETQVLARAIIWKLLTALSGDGMKVEQVGQMLMGLTPFKTGGNPIVEIVEDWQDYLQGRNPYDDFRGRPAISTAKWNEGGLTRLGNMFLLTGNRIGLLSANTYDKSLDSNLQKVTELPLLERILSVTNYGLTEREEWEKAVGKQEKNKDLEKLLKDYYAEPSNDKLLKKIDEYIVSQKGEEPDGGWTGTDKSEATRLRQEFKREMLERSGDSNFTRISKSGIDNAEKTEILDIQKKRLSEEEYGEFLAEVVRMEIVKGEMFALYAKDKNLSQDLVYKVVKESIPVLSAESNDTLLWELRKVDAMSNDTLYKLAKDGLITSAGYMKYKDLNSTSYEKRYGDKEEETKTKLF